MSTHDLTEVCACFALITGPKVGQWAQAAKLAEEKYGVQIEDGGAILVRPDNHVAWRSISETTNPADDLAAALSSILSR